MAKQVEGKDGEFGYKEFDSEDFDREDLKDETSTEPPAEGEPKPAESVPEKEAPVVKEPAAAKAEADDDDDDGDDIKEATASDPATGSAAASGAYEPNFKYRVQGEEKEFPKELQGFIKDKATEDRVRDLVTKGEGLDALKPRYHEAVQQRDVERSRAESMQAERQRLLALRSQNHRLFFSELGVSDDMIVKAGREILEAKHNKEDPQAWANFENMRNAERVAFQSQMQAQEATQSTDHARNLAHQQAMNTALNRPDIKEFSSRFDAIHGEGAFTMAVAQHGSFMFTAHKQYVDPMSAVEHVYQFQKKGMAPSAVTPAAVSGPVAPGATAGARPAALPNVGRGKNATPIGKRPKNLKEMREKIKRELRSSG